jgi:2-dehydropantoate 2-reductase
LKILVYGAGVIGCELAHMLCKGQNDVTLLARGKWKETIDNNGLMIRHYAQLRTTIDKIKTIDVLEVNNTFDLIFVTMQFSQLPEVLPILSANKSRYIVLIGNNMNAEGCHKQIIDNSLINKEIAFAFQRTGGRKENNLIISIHAGVVMTIGGYKSRLSRDFREQLSNAFSNSHIRLKDECNMDAWLKCHIAFILPVCFICYKLNGHLERATRTMINQIIDATIEAHRMLKALDYPIRPDGEEDVFIHSRRKCYWMLRIISIIPLGRLVASDHAMNAVNEMYSLDEAFEVLCKQTDVPMPTWNELREYMVKFNK